jgi:hypothetical protein
MPWKCPACYSQIAHAPYEDHPRPEVIYRCHICRLELVYDSRDGKLMLAPVEADEMDRRER